MKKISINGVKRVNLKCTEGRAMAGEGALGGGAPAMRTFHKPLRMDAHAVLAALE